MPEAMVIHDDWDTWFHNLLCKLMEVWGLDCQLLDKDENIRAEALDDVYRTNGLPPGLSDPKKLAYFVGLINDLEICLADPRNSLEPGTTEMLTIMIMDIRAELPK